MLGRLDVILSALGFGARICDHRRWKLLFIEIILSEFFQIFGANETVSKLKANGIELCNRPVKWCHLQTI